MHTFIHRVSEIKLSETQVSDTYTAKRLIITSKDMEDGKTVRYEFDLFLNDDVEVEVA
tara:strand:- start:75 stop:248 length:174 start_codon:yes stop_codon:yes gene_type:complete